jgi:hypothetical protein
MKDGSDGGKQKGRMKLRFEIWYLCLYIWSLSLFLSIDWFMACLCWFVCHLGLVFLVVMVAFTIPSLLGQIKDCKIGICCISAKNKGLRSKSKDWFTQKQDNVFANSDMSILVSWRCKEPINRLQTFLTGWIFRYISIQLLDHDSHSGKYWVNPKCTIRSANIIP